MTKHKCEEDVYGNCYTCGRSMLETPLKKELEDFANWLHKKGYIDTDYYVEEPKAIDAYLAHKAKTK